MDFSRGPQYPDLLAPDGSVRRRIWLAYFRQAPGMLLPDLDGIDVSGWEIDEESGVVWQAAIGVPSVLPTYPAKLTALYPPAFRSVDMVRLPSARSSLPGADNCDHSRGGGCACGRSGATSSSPLARSARG
jgi:hypothetical protein